MERLHDACGVVGIYAKENSENIDARRYLTLALTALQHRGQESAGMAVYDHDGKIVSRVRARGLVSGAVTDALSDADAANGRNGFDRAAERLHERAPIGRREIDARLHQHHVGNHEPPPVFHHPRNQ